MGDPLTDQIHADTARLAEQIARLEAKFDWEPFKRLLKEVGLLILKLLVNALRNMGEDEISALSRFAAIHVDRWLQGVAAGAPA